MVAFSLLVLDCVGTSVVHPLSACIYPDAVGQLLVVPVKVLICC